ncbi:hypothetical protein CAPTEDRAFT_225036 [Capitella teleta]|uniref:KxDL domain-containing protein n=1 Tax=Capitella teleta TaxID=283909 RepID=R7UQU5_CAPTE|nr:hypothetical protein CAPTEDRAFT_225036 [Capitella teleta]|eukprot:ELU08540.1 hypothetical protein CAPTEDRAFT_225036 [Capitella teleta]
MAVRDISLEFADWPPVPELQLTERPDPCAEFTKCMTKGINTKDIESMMDIQSHMLSRFEKTNEMLLNFNTLSSARYHATNKDFQQHTALLTSMKKDLDSVFQRIRTLKAKLAKQHPDSFTACTVSVPLAEEEEEEEELEEEVVPSESNNSV